MARRPGHKRTRDLHEGRRAHHGAAADWTTEPSAGFPGSGCATGDTAVLGVCDCQGADTPVLSERPSAEPHLGICKHVGLSRWVLAALDP